jgi:glycerol-3-phosphate dehydrogenase
VIAVKNDGVRVRDEETGEEFDAAARVVINATGAFSDSVRRMADPKVAPIIAPSQGIHLVFDGSFLAGDNAIMVPHTSDGRVMFAIPWHGHTLVGTTDTPVAKTTAEPVAMEEEIEFILQTASLYLAKAPTRADVHSVFAGIRPLVKQGDGGRTASLSRDHTIVIEDSGIVTIAGGKWTTYRHMAEDCVNQAATLGGLDERPCITAGLPIHGSHRAAEAFGALSVYGSDAPAVRELSGGRLHAALPYTSGEVLWAVREEMARTVEDVLARRTRALFLNARAAIEMSTAVAALMAAELDRDQAWIASQLQAFQDVAKNYLLTPDRDR